MDLLSCASPSERPNLGLFDYWIYGKSVDEVAKEIERSQRRPKAVSSISSSTPLSSGGSAGGDNSLDKDGSSILPNIDVTFKFARRGDKLVVDQAALRACEISDQFNLFHFLEHYLSQPSLLVNSQISNIDIQNKEDLIDKYWAFDDSVMRDILTRHKFTKSRKDLDELCESTGSSLRSVTRQVDNIKSVYRVVEDTTEQGATAAAVTPGASSSSVRVNSRPSLVDLVATEFLLKRSLSTYYVSAAFLMYSKFSLEFNNKVRFNSTWETLANTAIIMTSCLNTQLADFHKIVQDCEAKPLGTSGSGSNISGSTSGSTSGNSNALLNNFGEYGYLFRPDSHSSCVSLLMQMFPQVAQLEPDKFLLASLRAVKDAVSVATPPKVGEEAAAILARQVPSSASPLRGEKVDELLRDGTTIKKLVNVGFNLTQPKEFQNFLKEVEKICIPLLEAGLSSTDILTVVTCCATAVLGLLSMNNSIMTQRQTSGDVTQSSRSRESQVRRDWLRYVLCIRMCILSWLDPHGFRTLLTTEIRSL